jgi:hypothetical protein
LQYVKGIDAANRAAYGAFIGRRAAFLTDFEAREMSPPERYHRPMIDLGSLEGLHEHQHEVHCYCSKCERWRVLDLQRLIAIGEGGTRLPLRVRCLRCRQLGQAQIRPPMPTQHGVGLGDTGRSVTALQLGG